MPNWCACHLEVESETFIKTLHEKINYDKIANMLFLILKMPVMGYEKEKIYPIIQTFGEKAGTLENLEKLEKFFNDFYPNEILDNDASIQTILDQVRIMNFGKNITPKEIRESIKAPNLIQNKDPDFSLFSYTIRPMKLFLSEQFQFSINDEEEAIVAAEVIDNNRQELGTKWDASDVCIDICDNKVSIDFDTAWSPPIPVIERIAEQFQDATIKLVYAEQGSAYCGQLEFDKGDPEKDVQSDLRFMVDEEDEENENEDDFSDLDNWDYDESIELELLNGRFGG